MRLISWNVNGIRAAIKKDFMASMKSMAPDVLCLQEIRAQDDQVRQALAEVEEYQIYTNSAQKKGYAGTAVLTRIPPADVRPDLGKKEHDQEGRVLTLEFERFFLVNVYTPNSGSDLQRLDYRQQWDADFLRFLKDLEQEKPVITCGDFNVAHKAIDLARPKPNYNKTAGFMQEEIDGMTHMIESGFVDTFRYLHPDTVKYSWWSFRANARQKNVGWRIDYFLVSPGLTDSIQQADILNEIMGSDHCPVLLELSLA